jgi:dTDP-glucose 4,6-dehydratase
MNQLASEIISLVGSNSKISFKPLPGDDPKDREPDIVRAKLLLDWSPRFERIEGLQKTVNYFRAMA